jgi:DNA (cytosine-5)-methyltransferase 1
VATDKPIISLFSGAMGLDLGLESAKNGIRSAVALEINPIAVKTIKLNKPTLPVFNNSIECISTAEILKAADLKHGEAFAVIGGPCCQSFSTAGKRESLGDEKRGGLFRHFTRIVREARPRFFVMENVKGILSAAIRHRPLNKRGPGWPALSPDEEFGSALRVIREELAELNYHVVFGLFNCADYGVPQKRQRVVFIGSRDGEPIYLPHPTHTEATNNCKIPWVTLRDAVGNLVDAKPESVKFTAERIGFLKRLKAGQNWTDLPKQLQRKALGAAYDSWGGRVGFCRRLDWDEPAPTLTTAPDGRATMLCHPSKLRPLTIGEYSAIQQFPTDWKFAGSTRQKYIQIGNAVPIGLGRAIGEMLLAVSGKKSKRTRKLLGQVICADSILEARLKKAPRTKLHPPRLRKYPNAKSARVWLQKIGA